MFLADTHRDILYSEPASNALVGYSTQDIYRRLTYMQGMYTRFPSMTSTKSSAVQFGSRMATSALASLYSLSTALISSWSMFVRGTVLVIAIPPLSFLRTVMLGGFLFRRIPKPSSSCSISRLSLSGLRTSRIMKMRLHVRATGDHRLVR